MSDAPTAEPNVTPGTPDSTRWRIDEALAWACQRVRGRTPRLDAEVLLAHCIGCDRSWLRAWPQRCLSLGDLERFRGLVGRREAGCPVAYLTGRRAFWTLNLHVDASTLIPRPETELLVELALSRLPSRGRLLDLGTGSGALALAIASERPDCRVDAVDSSAAAIAVARGNARASALGNVRFRIGDWYAPVASRRYGVIVANPPYIDPAEPEPYRDDAAFEPRDALLASEAGLAAARRVVEGAPAHLLSGGCLIVEHGYRQGPAVRALMARAGLQRIETCRDLAGHERATLGYRGDSKLSPWTTSNCFVTAGTSCCPGSTSRASNGCAKAAC